MINQIVQMWVLAIFTASVGVFAQNRIPSISSESPAWDRLRQLTGIRNFTVQSLQSTGRDEMMIIPLRIDGRSCKAVLYPFSVRAPSFRVRMVDATGAVQDLPIPPISCFRGRLEGDLEGHIVAGIRGSKIDAVIQISDTPDVQWVICPIEGVEGFVSTDHLIFRSADAPRVSYSCGVSSSAVLTCELPPPPASAEVPMSVRMCEIACDTDVEFYQACGSNPQTVTATIEQIINGVSQMYELDAQVAFEITEIVIRAEEPDSYSSTNASTLLASMQDYWTANYSDIPCDIAHLFTGKQLGSILGLAYLNTLCYSTGYGLSCPFTTGFTLDKRIAVAAHEIAHNFGVIHCDANPDCRVMCSQLGECSGGYNSLGSSDIIFIQSSRNRFCLTDQSVVWHSLIPPLVDDFSYARGWVATPPDPAKWIEVDRAQVMLGRLEINMSKGVDGDLRCGTLRTWPMKIDRPTLVSMRICPNEIISPWSLKIDYLDATYCWKNLDTIVSPNALGQSTSTFTSYQWRIPADGYGDFFALRLSGYGNNPNQIPSDWYVDDISITEIANPADINGDQRVDLVDWALFAAAWLSHEGDTSWNPACNLKQPSDKIIDLYDLNVLVENWLK
jgi:hypothetical protein